MKKFLFSGLLIATFSLSVEAEEIPGKHVLDYFAANCRSTGAFTQAALNDSYALIDILQKISADEDCRSVGGAISQLNMLNQQLVALQNVNATKSQIAELNAQEQELMVQLSLSNNATVQDGINSSLRALQVTRAGIIGKDSVRNDLTGPEKMDMVNKTIQTVNSSYAQLTQNQKCLAKNPSVLNTATSVMGAVGAAAMLVNPAVGLGLTAGSMFVGTMIETGRINGLNRRIREVADSSIAAAAYKCGLETMSERWCRARDADSFLKFKARNRYRPTSSDLSSAIRLSDREIPVLLEWLMRIKSGVAPTNNADASRQNMAIQREAMVRILDVNGTGLIEENRFLYENAPDDNARWNIVKKVVSTLAPGVMYSSSPSVGSSISNPLNDVLSAGFAPYFLLGFEETNTTIRNDDGYYALDEWPRPTTFTPRLDDVKVKFVEWITLARNRVNLELQQVLQPDAVTTLSIAFERGNNPWKLSPIKSLGSLIEFIEKNKPQEEDRAFIKIYNETLAALIEIKQITEDAIISKYFVDDAKEAVKRIYEKAQLQYGTVVLQARLELIVRLSILELLRHSPREDQILVAQLLAAERFTETLMKMSGKDNLSEVEVDIEEALLINLKNLRSFMSLFGKNIQAHLQKLKKNESKTSGTEARLLKQSRTRLCFLLLAAPNSMEYIDLRLCQGLKIAALSEGGPETPVINRELFSRDINDRACVYSDYFRQTKIHENWGVVIGY